MKLETIQAYKQILIHGYKPSDDYTLRASSRKDIPVLKDARTAIERNFILHTSAQATCICPITGLLVENDLPPTGDFYLNAVHPIAYNAMAILDNRPYWRSLSPSKKAGLILASLHTLNKVTFVAGSNAFAVNTRMAGNITEANLDAFLIWIDECLRTTGKRYPTLELSHTNLTHSKLTDYMNTSLSLDFVPAPAKEATIKNTLKTQSSATALKRLNEAAHDEWLEVSSNEWFPKAFKEKNKAHVKNLVGIVSAAFIESLFSTVLSFATEQEEQIAAELFVQEVRILRKKAEALGVYKSALDEWDEPGAITSPATASAPTNEAVAEILVTEQPEVKEAQPISPAAAFLAKIAAIKGAK